MFRCCAAALAVLISASIGQAAQRPLTEADMNAWSQVGASVVSPDGATFAYVLSSYQTCGNDPCRSDPRLIIRSLKSSREISHDLGKADVHDIQLQISPSGDWLAVTDRSKGASPNSIGLYNIARQEWNLLSAEGKFEFSRQGDLLLSRGPITPAGSRTLSIYDLRRQKAVSIPGVTADALNPGGDTIAYADAIGAHLLHLSDGRITTISSGSGFQSFQWSPSGEKLAFIKSDADPQEIMVAEIKSGQFAGLRRFMSSKLGMPPGFKIVTDFHDDRMVPFPLANLMLSWRDDEDGIYFAIERSAPTPARQRMRIWHWQDAWPASIMEGNPTKRFLAFLRLDDGGYVQLADDEVTNVIPQLRGQFALGYRWRNYGPNNAFVTGTIGPQRRDYFLVEVATGRKTPLQDLQDLKSPANSHAVSRRTTGELQFTKLPTPQMSPDGTKLFYLSNAGHYKRIDVNTIEVTEVTSGLSDWRARPLEDRYLNKTIDPFEERFEGWTADNAYMLVSHDGDVWALPSAGGAAINLSEFKSEEHLTLNVLPQLESSSSIPGPQTFDIAKPIYVSWSNWRSATSGLARIDGLSAGARIFDSAAAGVRYLQGANGEPMVADVHENVGGGDYYALQDGRRKKRITNTWPQRAMFRLPPKPIYLRYNLPSGEERSAVLHLPFGYKKGQRYPTVVEVYLADSGMGIFWQIYNGLDFDWDVLRWQRQGYAVLVPTILPRESDPVALSVIDTTAAVNASAEIGVVDRSRLALFGHSWGGHLAMSILARTNIFKAAIEAAGVGDLRSLSTQITDMQFGSARVEGMMFMKGPPWQFPADYSRNSPVEQATDIHTPLLMVYGRRDENVPFVQGLEIFSTMRRRGVPAVMLDYEEGDHNPYDNDDYYEREREYLGHFLKGGPVPKWWQASSQ